MRKVHCSPNFAITRTTCFDNSLKKTELSRRLVTGAATAPLVLDCRRADHPLRSMIWDFIFAESFFEISKRALLALFETDRVSGEPRIDSGLDGGKPREISRTNRLYRLRAVAQIYYSASSASALIARMRLEIS